MWRQILIVIIFLPSVAFSEDAIKKDIASCAVLPGELGRLQCYDDLAQRNNLAGEQVLDHDIETEGEWDISVKINPIDDSKTVVLWVSSSSGVSRYGRPIKLILRCLSNETDVYINWNDFLGSEETSVLTRIGKQKAETSLWSLSTDNQASFHPQPISFIKQLMKSNRLVSQTTPYNESPVTVIFNISDLESAIKPLRETCNW